MVNRQATVDPATILVVDDDQSIRYLFTTLLTADGHSIETAENGEQALALLGRISPDLVIMDMIMPEMGGLETLIAIKKNPATQNVPVIVASTVNEIGDIASCIDNGAVDFLIKPVNRELLRARIRNTLALVRDHKIQKMSMQSITRERETLNQILRSILPPMIAEEYKSIGLIVPREAKNAAVMFADLTGFTHYCHTRSPADSVEKLDAIMERLDSIAKKNKMEKIKVVGDAYLAVSGLLIQRPLPVLDCIKTGLEMIECVQKEHPEFGLRVGIHLGDLIAGAIGNSNFSFDIWGDTVNVAHRVQSLSENNMVYVSDKALDSVSDFVVSEDAGDFDVKGAGRMKLHQIIKILQL